MTILLGETERNLRSGSRNRALKIDDGDASVSPFWILGCEMSIKGPTCGLYQLDWQTTFTVEDTYQDQDVRLFGIERIEESSPRFE